MGELIRQIRVTSPLDPEISYERFMAESEGRSFGEPNRTLLDHLRNIASGIVAQARLNVAHHSVDSSFDAYTERPHAYKSASLQRPI